MEALQHCRAMEAFCRQHAKMDGEDPAFWLGEAECWAARASVFSPTAAVCCEIERERQRRRAQRTR